MTRMSFPIAIVSWICISVSCSQSSLAEDEAPAVLKVPAAIQEEANRRSLDRIHFEGNQSFTSDAIREALGNQNEIHRHLWPEQPGNDEWTGTSWGEFTATISQQILSGYRHAGYLNAKVQIESDQLQPVMVSINEGPVFTADQIIIQGTSAEAAIRSRLSSSGRLNEGGFADVFRVSHPGDTRHQIWKPSEAAAVSDKARQEILDRVNEVLGDLGYNFAEASVDFDVDQIDNTVDLRITVIPGQQTPIRNLLVSGLSGYSQADVRRIINLQPGSPASPKTCRQVESALVGSGRFLFAKCETEIPFAADQPVDVEVRVHEYSETIANQPLTKVQQGVLKYAEWLSRWSESDNDFVVDVTFDFENFVASMSDDWKKQHEVATKLLGASFKGLNVRLVASPKDGVHFRMKAELADEELAFDYSLLHSKGLVGIISHTNQRSWLVEGRLGSHFSAPVLKIGLRGKDPADGPQRIRLKMNLEASSDVDALVVSELSIQPTALLCGLTSRFLSSGEAATNPPAVVAVNQNGIEVVRCRGSLFTVEIDADSGALSSAVANYSGCQCQIDVQSGQLQRDIVELQNSAKRHKNFYEAGNGFASVANFVATEFPIQSDSKLTPLLRLAFGLIKDPEVQSSVQVWLDQYSAPNLFPLPLPETTASLPIWLTPQNHVLKQIVLIVSAKEAKSTADQLRSVTMAAMSKDEFGPISCALLADRFRQLRLTQFARTMAALGQRRLTQESLISELEVYLQPNSLTGAIANRCVQEIKKLDDDQLAKLIGTINPINVQIGHRNLTIEQATLDTALTVVHGHSSDEPKVVLRDLLARMCESNLEDLDQFFTSAQQPPSKSIFRRASSQKSKPKLKR